ncbi:MAG: hypothetical protein KME64_08925 [Scytonematopsis contorta HA4267-MV1]|jgi:hypothetical protein|nr:hypothetical protein [Scytonematopsis contorta HA4267-MV1]
MGEWGNGGMGRDAINRVYREWVVGNCELRIVKIFLTGFLIQINSNI